ncbi:hypothetical protein M440DRAFT_248599 [Trichoderma longibrachiatum ATCC 18648]|uniref:Secreted protein n=1 Tax=Trichoderma longibrachiatum ATCC 18648 TaxID=983965 RepID=A0A2T4CDZ9_TRILO|nr:hypothetical protein M440DRAFT_248599 [Trichoderma longibrachiatum ATCC 18648]
MISRSSALIVCFYAFIIWHWPLKCTVQQLLEIIRCPDHAGKFMLRSPPRETKSSYRPSVEAGTGRAGRAGILGSPLQGGASGIRRGWRVSQVV